MPNNNRSYRIRTEIGSYKDKYVSVNLENDIDIIELLSLKINTESFYKMHSSNYGCIAGRVIANGGIGVPNAKISIFVERDRELNDNIINALYPYSSVFSKDDNYVRYNLLPDSKVSECHTPVGTFPSKRMLLDDSNVIEVFDRYYKYTTCTNDAGDYMLFGVPTGDVILHTDIDLSDCGHLSQRPYDMIYKGYNINQFDSSNKFKSDTNLDSLTQIITQNENVYVYPFWGDDTVLENRITRNDIEIQYKFTPTCVFLGSVITDEKSNGFSKKCIPSVRMGKMDRMVSGNGTIEMIRKTPDNKVEEYSVMGNQTIDGEGVWCYQIPMNLDYMVTDEYGNLIPSNDTERGIPTRTRVRFRVSLTDYQSDYSNVHLTKLLVPNNPKSEEDVDYIFGTNTKDNENGEKSFRDLFWNNVYTVKSYIPRIQKSKANRNDNFTGFKNINVNNGNNPIPYNNIRINITFMFVLQCAIFKCLLKAIQIINFIATINSKMVFSRTSCTTIGDGMCPDLENWYFAPGCRYHGRVKHPFETTFKALKGESDSTTPNLKTFDKYSKDEINNDNEKVCLTNTSDYLVECVEINLAMENNVIQFDFYNDWINGLLYIPRWYVNIKKKKSLLFGLIRKKEREESCSDVWFHSLRRFTQQCALEYTFDSTTSGYTSLATTNGCSKYRSKMKCHKTNGRKYAYVFGKNGGIVHSETTLKGQKVYYVRPCEWNDNGTKINLFNTDIVLLGSMNRYDENSIPFAFEELESSSYILPPNLASTNLDNGATMYEGIFGGHSVCSSNQRTESPMLKVDTNTGQTMNNYNIWAKNSGGETEKLLDYGVTEMAGIDWGFEGPNQGTENRETTYQPGGHFLGISCLNSEVNVKSCVNLSRICEFGSMPSQRNNLRLSDKQEAYIAPTGLIARDEISDSEFRHMFAIMNHNGLRTKRDDRNMIVYDLIDINPQGFAGEMKNIVSAENSGYNDLDGVRDNLDDTSDATKLYRRTIEDFDRGYYSFRLGLNDSDYEMQNVKKKYASWDKNKVSMPMYENSYYFYFGIKEGNTAIDKFYSNFYAKCEFDNGESFFEMEKTDATYCNKNGGKIVIKIYADIDSFNFSLTNDTTKENVSLVTVEGSENVLTVSNTMSISDEDYTGYKVNTNVLTVEGLTEGNYTLSISSDGYETVNGSFVISTVKCSEFSGITITNTDKTITVDGIIDGITEIIVKNGENTVKSVNTEGNNSVDINVNEYDETYSIYCMYNSKEVFIDAIKITDDRFGVYFGEVDTTTLSTLTEKGVNTNANITWVETVLANNNNIYREDELISFKKMVYYRESMYGNSIKTLDIMPINAIAPYTETVSGVYVKQTYDDITGFEEISFSGNSDYGHICDKSYIPYPTHYITSEGKISKMKYYKGYAVYPPNEQMDLSNLLHEQQKLQIYVSNVIENGGEYVYKLNDSNPKNLELTIPIIYKPFFVYLSVYLNISEHSYDICYTIYNGLKKNGINKFEVNGINVDLKKVNNGTEDANTKNIYEKTYSGNVAGNNEDVFKNLYDSERYNNTLSYEYTDGDGTVYTNELSFYNENYVKTHINDLSDFLWDGNVNEVKDKDWRPFTPLHYLTSKRHKTDEANIYGVSSFGDFEDEETFNNAYDETHNNVFFNTGIIPDTDILSVLYDI